MALAFDDVLLQPGESHVLPRDARGLALLHYMKMKGESRPAMWGIGGFHREKVGIDPDGPLSRFRLGECRDLIDRVGVAKKL